MRILISRQHPQNLRSAFAMVAAAVTFAFARPATADAASPSSAASATPQPSPPMGPNPRDEFGHRGQLVVTGAAQVNIEANTETSSDVQVLFAPSADLFVAEGFSIGAMLTYQRQTEPIIRTGFGQAQAALSSTQFELVYVDADTIGAGIRFGYNVRFGPSWSFWPTASFAWQHTWIDGGATAATEGDDLSLGLFAPILFHPAPHFFVGLGPGIDVGFATGLFDASLPTEYGLRLVVGGWADLYGRNPS